MNEKYKLYQNGAYFIAELNSGVSITELYEIEKDLVEKGFAVYEIDGKYVKLIKLYDSKEKEEKANEKKTRS